MPVKKKRTHYRFSDEQIRKIMELWAITDPIAKRRALKAYAKSIKRTYGAVFSKGSGLSKTMPEKISAPTTNKGISLNFTSIDIDLKNKRITFILE